MTAVEQPRVKRLSPAERRHRIVEAAARVALGQGLEEVTYRSVAEASDCTRGLVHHYFDSVDALEAEAFGHAAGTTLEAVFARVDEADGAVESLRTLLLAWVSDEPDQHARLWLDAWCRSNRSPAVKDGVDRIMRAGHARVAGLLARGLADGSFAPHDPDAVAWQLLTALDGVIIHVTLGVNRGLVDVRRTMARFAEKELGLPPEALSTVFDTVGTTAAAPGDTPA
ncbi:TetR/AcrR family transcriptional regulator [Kitasatospora sp. NPDC057015]|uniref:TetR/AcrR family transcriptional regulator n=1 Tax=Kitasatospora sp. NPDC057015 TaxID=3346001 RepID=UPI00362E102A